MSNEFIRKVRERAYQIRQDEGRTDGREQEHWRRAERELAGEHPCGCAPDAAGRDAAREYDDKAGRFSRSGQAETKAREAQEALDGPEAAALKKAETAGKSHSKAD
jgi:hypothetical protein